VGGSFLQEKGVQKKLEKKVKKTVDKSKKDFKI